MFAIVMYSLGAVLQYLPDVWWAGNLIGILIAVWIIHLANRFKK